MKSKLQPTRFRAIKQSLFLEKKEFIKTIMSSISNFKNHDESFPKNDLINFLSQKSVDAYKLAIYQLGIDEIIKQISFKSKDQGCLLQEFWTQFQHCLINMFSEKFRDHSSQISSLKCKIKDMINKIDYLCQENEQQAYQIRELMKINNTEKIALKSSAQLLKQELEIKGEINQNYEFSQNQIINILPNFNKMLKNEAFLEKCK